MDGHVENHFKKIYPGAIKRKDEGKKTKIEILYDEQTYPYTR